MSAQTQLNSAIWAVCMENDHCLTVISSSAQPQHPHTLTPSALPHQDMLSLTHRRWPRPNSTPIHLQTGPHFTVITDHNPHVLTLNNHWQDDQKYQKITHYIWNSFPDPYHELSEQCRQYWKVCSQHGLDDGIIVCGCHLLISFSMRFQVLQELHASHQGTVHTKLHAKLIIYWPRINNNIEIFISSYNQCQDHYR